MADNRDEIDDVLDDLVPAVAQIIADRLGPPSQNMVREIVFRMRSRINDIRVQANGRVEPDTRLFRRLLTRALTRGL